MRRIEAVTGPAAFAHLERAEAELDALAETLRSSRENLLRRVDELLEERAQLNALLDEMRQGGGVAGQSVLHEAELPIPSGARVRYRGVRLKVRDSEDARRFGDTFREEETMAAAVVVAESPDGSVALHTFVTDDLIGLGVRAGDLVREVAALTGGRGGGRPHMAQGGIEEPAKVEEAVTEGEAVLRRLLDGNS